LVQPFLFGGCLALDGQDRVQAILAEAEVHAQRPQFRDQLGKVMFEAADPEVFAWYVKNYGPEVNLFVDHSQIVQLECLRSGIWGTKSLWGRVLT
jgi:hypothetical protein